ncbi:hypothetical protein [Marinomonas posidonica]|uniref:Uncharacterized protein n=1 Tax=Marinomonas posidonica (strain CECT 7376 / NCIMB 14433 / IVIA-Po-181) TaxID=491952 RepID=F6CUZ2_MARPP|nr:hypothetical protein [Marinomonas posidonica]AEF55318.1 hypothetical protein Mar181_2282 [Marinomonas posidonica IVIA-Po-181]
MYFWNIEALKNDIRADNFSEKERFIYFVIYFVFSAIGLELVMYMPIENANLWDYVDSFLNILIVLVGTVFAYKANGSSSGNDFLGKYFSISFVVLIRFLIYLIPLLVSYIIYYEYAYSYEEVATNYIDVIPFLVLSSLLYWNICRHIEQVNS